MSEELTDIFKRNIAMHKNGPTLTSDQFSDEVRTEMQGFIRGLERGLEIVELTRTAAPIPALRTALEMIRNMRVYLGNTHGDSFFLRDFYEGKLEKAIEYAEQALAAEVKRLTEENARLREALEHYGSADNWRCGIFHNCEIRGEECFIRTYTKGVGYDHARKILGDNDE